MTLKERLAEYVRACFTGLWIESHEHQDALRDMAQLCAEAIHGSDRAVSCCWGCQGRGSQRLRRRWVGRPGVRR